MNVFCRRTELNEQICAKKKANGLYFYKSHNEVKRRPTQLNFNPIGVKNQKKFAPNPSLIRIRISVCAPIRKYFGHNFLLKCPIEMIQVGLES